MTAASTRTENALATWERVTRILHADGILDLSVGQPAKSLLPHTLLQKAVINTITGPSDTDSRHLLQYGATAGSLSYREAVGKYLTQLHGYPIGPSSIFETNGNSHGISLCATTFARPGDTIFVEDPTYFLAHKIFRDAGVNIVPVPQLTEKDDNFTRHQHGTINLDILADMMDQHPQAKFIYLVPTGQNPRGISMPTDHRRRLVRMCHSSNTLLVCDDVYQLLTWSNSDGQEIIIPSMRSIALEEGCVDVVISLGTWSKILGPGLRLGWIEGSDHHIDLLLKNGMLQSGGAANQIVDCLVTSALISGDVGLHMDFVKKELKRRSFLLAGSINTAAGANVVQPALAGYFLWVNCRGCGDISDFQRKCKKDFAVNFLPGDKCYLNDIDSNFVRVSFAYLDDDELKEAGHRLGSSIAEAKKCKNQ